MSCGSDGECQKNLSHENCSFSQFDLYKDSYKNPILVDTMVRRLKTQYSSKQDYKNTVSGFKDFLERMLAIVIQPVRQVLGQERITYSTKLVSHVCSLLSILIAELTFQTTGADIDLNTFGGRSAHVAPSRFPRMSPGRMWNTGNGSPDAICFSVDRSGIYVVGICIYGGLGSYEYELELLNDQCEPEAPHDQRWIPIELVKGSFSYEDCINDLMEIKFARPVPIKENVKYAIRLRSHGGRTNSGDGGLSTIKGPDGTIFHFTTSSLSLNGTNVSRGQISRIIYHTCPQDSSYQHNNKALVELHSRKCALDIVSSIVKISSDLLYQVLGHADEKVILRVGSTHIISMLLPLVLAHVGQLAVTDPRSAVKIISLIEQLLPPVTTLNQLHSPLLPLNPNDMGYGSETTTSFHHAVIESDHPYKPATVSHYKVTFSDAVKWMAVDFDKRCGTAQMEDSLQLYVPAPGFNGNSSQPQNIRLDNEINNKWPYWPILKRFTGTENWPNLTIVVPGNEITFSLESATDYVKDEKACYFGFKCNVVGYEWIKNPVDGLKHLEKELSYIGGMSASSLIKKDLLLPPTSLDEIEEEFDLLNTAAQQVYNMHSGLLSKGFALTHPPTIHQALDGVLPSSSHSNEMSFLKDFVAATPGTSGGRLARWIQPDSYIDPKKCEVNYGKDDVKCGWPTLITIITRDQYGDIVHVPHLNVEVKAIPVERKNVSDERKSKMNSPVFGVPPPNLSIPYQPSFKDKMCYYAISVMRPYERYSFEELRYLSPILKRPSETLLVQVSSDCSYFTSWTPGAIGWYSIQVVIDGYHLDDVHRLEVIEPPQGIPPPSKFISKKLNHQMGKVCRTIAKYSAGLRIRSHPSLQSEQVGVIPPNELMTFTDEMHNDDGVWLRVSQESVKKYCQNHHGEAWSLQYNKHSDKTLLLPLEEPKKIYENSIKHQSKGQEYFHLVNDKPMTDFEKKPVALGLYELVKCASSGHNVRTAPHIKSPPVGMLSLGNQINVVDYYQSFEGTWVKLDDLAMCRYCYNVEGEAWSLAHARLHGNFLQFCGSNETCQIEAGEDKNLRTLQDPFVMKSRETNIQSSDSGVTGLHPSSGVFHFGTSIIDQAAVPLFEDTFERGANNFLFGSTSHTNRMNRCTGVHDSPSDGEQESSSPNTANKISALQRWLQDEDSRAKEKKALPGEVPPEFMGVSVRDLVKAIGESRANGNGLTPSNTPPRTRSSRSSSPKPILRRVGMHGSGPLCVQMVAPGTRASLGSSINEVFDRPSLGSVRSNSLSVLPDTRGSSPKSLVAQSIKISSPQSDRGPLLRTSSHNLSTRRSPPNSTTQEPVFTDASHKNFDSSSFSKTTTQTGTQTSPPDNLKGHFPIGFSKLTESLPHSPKLPFNEHSRQFRMKHEKSNSSAFSRERYRESHGINVASHAPPKEAVSPSVAESLRAVFCSFLWHEGIVHDAMACASFLKFHPGLTKHINLKEEKVNRRERSSTSLSKEQKARMRHSVEVAASSYLRIKPSTLETMNWSVMNANANKNQVCMPVSGPIREESAIDFKAKSAKAKPPRNEDQPSNKFGTSPNVKLPPALHYLVILWEEVNAACKKAIAQQMICPSPMASKSQSKSVELDNKKENQTEREKKQRKRNEWRFSAVAILGHHAITDRLCRQSLSDKEGFCELCGNIYKLPLTYHMKDAHPGCGNGSDGYGYNSLGTFCNGWTGHCGEGGVMGITWYLMCQKCRTKYIRERHQAGYSFERPRKAATTKKKHSQIVTSSQQEPHQVMRNNAMFLLQFGSSYNGSLKNIHPFSTSLSRRDSYSGRNSHQPLSETSSYYSPFPNVMFQCLQTLGVSESDLSLMSDTFFQNGSDQFVNGKYNDMHEYFPSSLSVAQSEKINSSSSARYSEARKSTGSDYSGSRSFHRSISIGVNPCDWQKLHDSAVVGEAEDITHNRSGGVIRKRNNSSSGTDETGLSLLCHPSAALTKLVHLVTDKRINTAEVALCRPVMKFILQRHDLKVLHLAIKQAIRKSACRIYAMQALNWLLRSVTQPTSLHNLLWCFMDAMIVQHNDASYDKSMDYLAKKENDPEPGVCEHPLSDITICGDAAHPLPSVFHNLLQTISDLMMLLPLGSSLQQVAMCCWCIKFRPSDHAFLHRSHVFSNISKILSRSEDLDDMAVSFTDSMQVSSTVEQQINLTPSIEIKSSSRQGMISSLTDQCTDTFWESGDEDRNKQKYILLTCNSHLHHPHGIYVHVDNTRDVGQRVSYICFKSGPSVEDLVKLLEVTVDPKYYGWVYCPILKPGHCVIKLDVKGPDNTIRLRQIILLGSMKGESLSIGKPIPASLLQQRNCESETLKVFRVLTSQVFGKLVSANYESGNDEKMMIAEDGVGEMLCNPESSNDLKEHMVGILFSQSKLTDLQKQVCTHIVQAIRKETSRVGDEWEATLRFKKQSGSSDLPNSSDVYCFEMLSMVLALSGSSVGRQYLAQQYTLLKDLLTLLHTGSARVQRQVTLLLRRVLPEVMPALLANILGVPSLPPTDYSIVAEANSKSSSSSSPLHSSEQSQSNFDMHRMGILDVFLSCIAKVITVQMKVKNSQNGKGIKHVSLATSLRQEDFVGGRWWLRGDISRKLAEDIIILLKDMAAGKLSKVWAAVTKDAIAENILSLNKLDATFRHPSECIKTPILWLSLASLCVLNEDHVERLTSGQWLPGTSDGETHQPRPTCDNHDDNETQAIIKCNICGDLCTDCDRYLHLHSKTRTHQRQVFKEEEEAIKVDLHEGCGRIKLYWVMVLADSHTLKAMVEFREGDRIKGLMSSVGTCRFCGLTGTSGVLAVGNVCGDKDCQENNKIACVKTLSCGHMCQGVRGEHPCLPCLHGCGNNQNLKQDADDMCMICFTEALACAPSIQLGCGHVFHLNCCKQVLSKKWTGPRITFGFCLCPVCKCELDHPLLLDLLQPLRVLYDDVRRKALMRLEYEGLHKIEGLLTKTKLHSGQSTFAMDKYAYYVCYKCKKAYYGGEARCDAEAAGGDDYDPCELVCGGCSDVSRAQMCSKHGADFLEYKCRYCCSVAVFFCFGTTHFCNTCHDDFQRITNIPKLELPHCPAGPKAHQLEGEECPLHVKHPPTGEEFALGCGVCRNAHTF